MILGFIEHQRGALEDSTLQMLTLARGVAEAVDTALEAIVVGAGGRSLADRLGEYGVSRVHVATGAGLDDYAPEAWAACIASLIESQSPEAVLASGADRGNEVMAYVAARLGEALAANCIEVQPGETYEVRRLRWGGSLFERARLHGKTKLLTVAPHMIEVQPVADASPAQVREFAPELAARDFRVRVSDRVAPEAGITLTTAPVVVGGGRGVGSAEGFAKLEDLAAVLGGAVGCSRAVTNNGWRPHSDQVGQTGARITPDLYIACGISGAIQHWVGCMGAKKILVINTDPEAPIIAKSDYAVIGDLHEVLPALCEALRALQE
ncbi:MAG: electron transfer flavoprotein subunit alpha/FixB family protein, partial [Anaerolineales bacterium]